MLEMSKLSETAVYQKPIERQRVSSYLQVFCEETATVLELYGRQHCVYRYNRHCNIYQESCEMITGYHI